MGWRGRDLRFEYFCALESICLLLSIFPAAEASVGVVYGANGNNLPLPSQVVQLLQSNGVTMVRIYDPNSEILNAFSNSGIEIIVGVTNLELASIGLSNTTAAAWVTDNIVPYVSTVNITAIAVGSEVLTSSPSLSPVLVEGMKYIHDALITNNLDAKIRVSTPSSTDILQTSYPPSQGTFNSTLTSTLTSILNFISYTGSYFMLNAYPYYTYQANPLAINLDYALFQPSAANYVTDTYNNLSYSSLFDALVDATYSAMAALNFTTVDIVVSETGWPHAGDSNEVGPSIINAQTYNSNLAKRIYSGTGTPIRPVTPIVAFIYELFNENLRTGPTSQRNWGIFNGDGTAVYAIDLTGSGRAVVENGTYATWCVAKTDATESGLQQALDYACGQGGVNCSAILIGGACYQPNTLVSHASYAFNAYYQKYLNAPGTCDFKGAAQKSASNPSYGNCIYTANNISYSNNTSPGGSSASGPLAGAAPDIGFQGFVTLASLLVLLIVNLRYIQQ